MNFEDLFTKTDSDSLSQKDKIGLAYYFLDRIKDKDTVKISEIVNLLNDSRLKSISKSTIAGYTSRLLNEDILTRNKSGYRLTIKGLDKYKGFVNCESKEIKEEFIQADLISDVFYQRLIEHINLCNEFGIDEATMVLCRKLLENLLIDILRQKYGNQEIDSYFNPDKNRFWNFSKLIKNFNQKIDDFRHYSSAVEQSLIDKLNSVRERGNSSAHSIEIQISDRELEEFREKVDQVSTILFDVKRKI